VSAVALVSPLSVAAVVLLVAAVELANVGFGTVPHEMAPQSQHVGLYGLVE